MMSAFRSESIRRWSRVVLPFAALAALLILFPKAVSDTFTLVLGGALIALMTQPLAKLYERRLGRRPSALFAILSWLAVALALAWMLLPSLIRQLGDLGRALPQSVETVRQFLETAAGWAQRHFGIQLSAPNWDGLPVIARGTLDFAGSVADLSYRVSLMFVLAYFFLCDRERLMIRVELLFPQSIRPLAVRMGNAVCREWKVYLRGQGLIAAAVGALAGVGLFLARVPSAFALGVIVGIFNMVPYFGPILGGIPAVLSALSAGLNTVLYAAGVLWLVQQIDGAWISPRIMSSLAGLSPATVLIAVFAGSVVGGFVGMLFAVPVVMAFRTGFRIFVQRYENV